MKPKYAYLIAAAAVTLTTAAAIFLPSALSAAHDRKLLGELHTQPAESGATSYRHQLSLVEKLRLLSFESFDTSTVSLSMGAAHDNVSIQATLIKQLEELRSLGLVSAELDLSQGTYDYEACSFYISTSDPSQTAIIWMLLYSTDDSSLICYLDDDTGKLLRLYYSAPYSITQKSAAELAQTWGNYLGLTCTEATNTDAEQYLIYDDIARKELGLDTTDIFDNTAYVTLSDGVQSAIYRVTRSDTDFAFGTPVNQYHIGSSASVSGDQKKP